MCEFLCYDEVRKKIKFILVISKKIVSLQTENVNKLFTKTENYRINNYT